MKSPVKHPSIAAGLLGLVASAAWSDVTITKPDYSITFGSGWSMIDSANNLVGNASGIGGIALVRSQADDGDSLDLEVEAEALGDSLEAELTVIKEEVRTFGPHETLVIHVEYDTLRRVEREAAEMGQAVAFRNGTSQIYIVRSGGVRVNIIGVKTNPAISPYSGIEQAIPTLETTAPTPLAGPGDRPAPAWSMAGGKLRFAGEQPRAIAALDARGRLVARLGREGGTAAAAWALPSGPGPVFLIARMENNRLSPLGWWKDVNSLQKARK